MPKNRLRLNFDLSSVEERQEFLDNYINSEVFSKVPPSAEELEMMGNYLLWGKDPDGKNSVQKKLVQIETRGSSWDRKTPESLEELYENPAFNEGRIRPFGTNFSTPRTTFSRSEALRATETSNPTLHEAFLRLFTEIDEVELELNFYDLMHERRTKPPRQELLDRVDARRQDELRQRAALLSSAQYAKKRHYLVDLRTQQYTLRDGYAAPAFHEVEPTQSFEVEPARLGVEIDVRPLGIWGAEEAQTLIFRNQEDLVPKNFDKKKQKIISDYLWRNHYADDVDDFDVQSASAIKDSHGSRPRDAAEGDRTFFDFRQLEHVYQLFLAFFDIEDAGKEDSLAPTDQFLRTLEYYVEAAQLDEMHSEILDMKIRKVINPEIAAYVNKKYEKRYTANYISTIFRQRIIPAINAAAIEHQKIICNIFFEEEFKECKDCGRTFLRDPVHFVRKTRASDGLASKCKECDKKDRQRRKERKETK